MTAVTPLILHPSTPDLPEAGFLHQAWQHGPRGEIGINSRYLTRDGQPWLPVMGEFHYSRFPASEWLTELRKMKAGGIDIVASYVFWNHHEDVQGVFDWHGNKDLRAFVQAAAQADLLFCLRVGPWVHGEARYGGFPDWLIETVPASDLRCNAPGYMQHVDRLYHAIGEQVEGLMWHQGGPIVAVQLENEYDRVGPDCGKDHIARLKTLALQSGLEVPLYTVTGWPTLDIPAQEVVPVSGAYADGFWQGSATALPPSGVFVFDTNRTIGEMGNVGGTPASGHIDPHHYPFFLAEAGGGMHQSYHRRPVISTDDVYATALTQIGSGANLYGYYMYHGGTNPQGSRGYLNETQATGYPNDVPLLGYDFHAPLGQYGQMRPSWGRLATLHHFVAAYGATLATLPATMPADATPDAADREHLRVSLRADQHGGFVFINNHVRHHPLPAMTANLRIELADGAVQLPVTPIASGQALIWPVGQRLGSAVLRYATAQPLTRLPDETVPVYVYTALDGIAPEFSFAASSVQRIDAPAAWTTHDGSVLTVRPAVTHTPVELVVVDHQGQPQRLIILNQQQADGCTPQWLRGRQRLVLSEQGSWLAGDVVHVAATGAASAQIAVFPADGLTTAAPGFATFSSEHAAVAAQPVSVTPLREASPQPLRFGPHISWRPAAVPTAPDDAIFAAHAAAWRLRIADTAQVASGRQWLLNIDYVGDAARLYVDEVLVDDQFFDGTPWQIGLDRFVVDGQWPELRLEILPAHPQANIFYEDAARAALAASHNTVQIRAIQLVPVQTLAFDFGRAKA
ncbi:beta-galactosidase [Amantichitinum ursilacus]|uniref:Beta-galactosidase n=1 Tax=Amantichitinum ursilacus TaxID=857265 RepID=A0A0N1JRZ9_9NEIS|nr:beta-galactosidase [Amantichitinum ursilacus]KPC50643.1 Beta-galactosidase precursor [Amantichitinum ursilacus]